MDNNKDDPLDDLMPEGFGKNTSDSSDKKEDKHDVDNELLGLMDGMLDDDDDIKDSSSHNKPAFGHDDSVDENKAEPVQEHVSAPENHEDESLPVIEEPEGIDFDNVPELNDDDIDMDMLPNINDDTPMDAATDDMGQSGISRAMEQVSNSPLFKRNIFSNESIMKWISRLPEDFKKSVQCDQDEGGDIDELSEELLTLLRNGNHDGVVDCIRKNQSQMNSFGRARRIRLMTVMARSYMDHDEDEGGSFQEIGILFLEDLKFMAEKAFAPRLLKSMMNENSLSYANLAMSDMNIESKHGMGG